MSPTLQQATADPHLHWRLLDTHGQVWVSLLWGHCSLLLGSGAHKVVCALQESVSTGLCKFWRLYGGLMVTSWRRLMPYSWLLHPVSLPLWQVTADLCLLMRYSNTQRQVWLSLCGISWCAQGFVWAFWASLAGMGFDYKCDFTPPTIFLGILLCPCMWGIFFLWDPTFSCRWLFSSEL